MRKTDSPDTESSATDTDTPDTRGASFAERHGPTLFGIIAFALLGAVIAFQMGC
jgi:hypothetical protein